MLKKLANSVFSFDVEWIPDPQSAEILYDTKPADGPGEDAALAFEALWAGARKDGDAPDLQPYLKTVLCRVVSLAGILREQAPGGKPLLKLVSLPTDPSDPHKSDEKTILSSFMKSVGNRKPQLVGYNSAQADVPILVQRAIINGLPGFGFSERPNKPWEGVDYFDARNSDYNLDLADAMGQFRDRPTLHQAATLSGIPGKLEVSGASVSQMWLTGSYLKLSNTMNAMRLPPIYFGQELPIFPVYYQQSSTWLSKNWSVTYWNMKFHKTAPICNAFYRSGIVYSL